MNHIEEAKAEIRSARDNKIIAKVKSLLQQEESIQKTIKTYEDNLAKVRESLKHIEEGNEEEIDKLVPSVDYQALMWTTPPINSKSKFLEDYLRNY